jgi:hypothetical protein
VFFRNRTTEEIQTMIAELTPVEETRAGRELIEKGIERGIEQGIEQGIERVTLVQLERVCGGLDAARRERVAALPAPQAEELALALLEFRSVADLDIWLTAHA